MALSNLSEWNEKAEAISSACGSACGAGDGNASDGSREEKPAACGSACGAGDGNAFCDRPKYCPGNFCYLL